ncbi:helix-turn-helix transcriptional regulator [Mucilaginibacter sp. SMC90]|uniref:winged helix-turn-helix transcriptional regulator n=1 Tax=Mucilaginibacter sp. SMC90 TaxID=2929803 RepID=UPI001FB201D5|nr:helix-turn-helix domain-containing protein [Mucilaginibacter sp. SMC90]UOE50269.1 helix-turn-helix transcriptional regulator [Mucilaginibacter sp. SMC90]
MYERKLPIQQECGLDLIREVVFGKWKIHLLYFISQGISRPGQLQKNIPEATRRVLNIQLKQLEDDELVAKTVYDQQPPKVEYYLTDLGKSVVPIINELGQWGDAHSEHLRRVISKRLVLPEA